MLLNLGMKSVKFYSLEHGSTSGVELRTIGMEYEAKAMVACCRGTKEVNLYIVDGVNEL